MHDALAAERRGIPAAAVMTDRFVTTANAVIEVNGMRDYPFVVIPHPIASDTDVELRANVLGQQGWELVAIDAGVWIFKRVAADDEPVSGALEAIIEETVPVATTAN